MIIDKKTAEKIVNKIIDDLTDRSGLQNEWEGIDSYTQKEIKDTWIDIIMKNS